MGAFETLVAEHEAIDHVLRAVATWASRLSARPDARAELRELVSFLAEHVDAVHHGKEEAQLLARMSAHGFSRKSGPVAIMLHEHAEERALLDALARHAARDASLSDQEADEIGRTASSWVDHLAHHIEKEERVLYPMVRAKLPPDALAALDADFTARGAEEERAKIDRAARALVARLGPASAVSPEGGSGAPEPVRSPRPSPL